MPEERNIILEVKTDDRLAPEFPAFSNFLQVSRVATEVQFEFLFVDINQVAVTVEKAKELSAEGPQKLSGLTVAKVILPALSFMQLRDHLSRIFDSIEKDLGKLPDVKEVQHGSAHVVST